MARYKYKNIVFLIGFWLVTLVFYFLFLNSSYFGAFKSVAARNTLEYLAALVLIKISGIVWPPIPGGIFTLASIPVLGWEAAFLADYTGGLIGSLTAYFLGKKFGLKLLSKLFDEGVIGKIQNIKIKKDKELEGVFLMRLLGNSLFTEAISYGAGLLKIGLLNFTLATIASGLLIGLPAFYLAGGLLAGKQTLVSAILIAILVLFFWKLKGRYFE